MSGQKTPKGLKQSFLDQINADKKIVEVLSDEELETVAGGYILAPLNNNTGVAIPGGTPNINTGVVSSRGLDIKTGVVIPY